MSTTAVLHFASDTTAFTSWSADAPHSTLGRLIGVNQSQTMGVGYMNIDGDSIPWTVMYDEVLVVTAGAFTLRLTDGSIDAKPGDVLWIPKGTAVAYEGQAAQAVYILYPVNWRALQSQATSA